MVDIPAEIINEILRRLPAKTLGRFKTVSKSWLGLISQPQFHKDHLNTSYKHTHLFYDSLNGTICTLPFNQLLRDETPKFSHITHGEDPFIFYGSCNGLVLGSVCSSLDDVAPFQHVILNPTTKELFEVPVASYETLDTNLLRDDCTYGFGYDSLTDDYKVVTWISSWHESKNYVYVYSLRNKTWRRGDDPYEHSKVIGSSVLFVDGFFHWIVKNGSGRLQGIVAFSLVDETFTEVPLPNLRSDVDCKLFVYGEKLGIFQGNEVHVMNEYGVKESWAKIVIHGIEVCEILICDVEFLWKTFINNCYFRVPIAGTTIFYEDGKIMLANRNRMWVYDVEEKSFRKTKDIKNLYFHGTYVESLVSPKFSLTNHKSSYSSEGSRVGVSFELCY